MDKAYLKKKFEEIFGEGGDIRFFFAPARINLIGEHIDYNGGYVFPAALTLMNVAVCRKRNDNLISLAADDIPGAKITFPLDKLKLYRGTSWGAYQLGCAYYLQEAGYEVPGCDMLYWGNVPFGSGLSSSASIEVLTCVALATLGGRKDLDMTEISLISQRCENKFCGVNCGIMDQFASANGKKNHAMLLDCNAIQATLVPLNLDGYSIIATNTNKKRGLADTYYNLRRAQCEQAVEDLKVKFPNLKYLCELTPDQLEENIELIKDKTAWPRARHAVQENARVLESVEVLKKGDIKRFGELMIASHNSLRDLYEMTGPELDALNDAALTVPGVIGSRMTGAGYGGCTVSIVKNENVEDFKRIVGKLYTEKTGLVPSFYISEIGDGAGELK